MMGEYKDYMTDPTFDFMYEEKPVKKAPKKKKVAKKPAIKKKAVKTKAPKKAKVAKKIAKAPKPKKEKLIVINFKLTAKELESLRGKAKRHAQGNLSGWIRKAGLQYVPKSN